MGLLNFLSTSSIMMTGVADSLQAPKGVWEWLLLKVFGFIGDYGLSIILFIIALKLVLLPIDIFQRVKMRKNQKINERIKPQLEELQKRYGNDKAMLSQKQMELNKKEGFSYFSSCLPLIITLVVFLTLLQGMNNISQYMIFRQYAEWYDTYTQTYERREEILGEDAYREYLNNITLREDYRKQETDAETEIDALSATLAESGVSVFDMSSIRNRDRSEITKSIDDMLEDATIAEATKTILENYKKCVTNYFDFHDNRVDLDYKISAADEKVKEEAQLKVVAYNDENANKFLWIKSIWRPDTTWSSPVFDSRDEFRNATAAYTGASTSGCGGCGSCQSCKSASGLDDELIETMLSKYDDVTAKIRETEKDKHNGYFILVALVVILSFLSQWITQRIQKKSGQFEANGAAGTSSMKIMMFIMPVMLGIFAISYTAAFALYMVTNSAMTILINVVTTLIMNSKDKSARQKVMTTVNKYGRPDPRDFNK